MKLLSLALRGRGRVRGPSRSACRQSGDERFVAQVIEDNADIWLGAGVLHLCRKRERRKIRNFGGEWNLNQLLPVQIAGELIPTHVYPRENRRVRVNRDGERIAE